MKKLTKKLISLPTEKPWRIMILTLFFTICAICFLPQTQIDTDPENMLSHKEETRIFHNNTKKTFDLNEMIIVGVINEKHPDGVFNPQTLADIYQLTEFAKTLQWPAADAPDKVEGVIEVDLIAPSLVEHISSKGAGFISFDWLMPEIPRSRDEALALRQRALSNPLLRGKMVSGDGKALSLYLPISDKMLSYKIYTELQRKVKEFKDGAEYHITGLPVAEGAIGVEMFTQMGLGSILSMLTILTLLLIFFKKPVLVILPLVIATMSILLTMGLMVAFGYPVHILSSMLPIFLMSISMVDAVHVLSEFFDSYTTEVGRIQTIKAVMEKLFKPMLYTSLTTSAGFYSLTFAPVPPARVFGTFLSIGVMAAWLFTTLFVPAYITLLPESRFKNFGTKVQQKRTMLISLLNKIGIVTYKHAGKFIVLFVVTTIFAAWGISRIKVNDNYARRFVEGHPIRDADTALNRHFAGTYTAYLIAKKKTVRQLDETDLKALKNRLKVFCSSVQKDYSHFSEKIERFPKKFVNLINELQSIEAAAEQIITHIKAKHLITAADEENDFYQEVITFLELEKERTSPFKRPEVLNYMKQLQAYLEAKHFAGKTTSVADVVCKVHQELTGGKPEGFKIPLKSRAIAECYMQFQQSHRPHDLWHMVTPDYNSASIWVQFPTGDSSKTGEAVDAVAAYIDNNPPPMPLEFKWAGLHYVNLVLEDRLVNGFLRSFIGSFVIVFIMMSILFRSTLWGFLCMIPLSVTLLLIYGITGIIGKDYDLPIAVLSALSIGMAVDFAIHFLERSRVLYRKQGSWEMVIPLIFGEPVRSITRNVLIIAIGFLPLLTAPLIPYKTTGLMLFTILSVSGLITILILPALMKLFEKRLFKKRKSTMKKELLILITAVFMTIPENSRASEPSLQEIIKKSYHASLYQGDDFKAEVTFTTRDKQQRERKRVLRIIRKDSGESDTDQKYFAYFLRPANIRKMTFLVHKYTEMKKEDDRWLYLPSLDLVKRIAAGDKRTSFAGTDFLYEDISGRLIDEDEHSPAFETAEEYVIKNSPKSPDTVEFSHYLAYINKQTFLPVKIEYYKNKRKYRVIEILKTAEINAGDTSKPELFTTVIKSVVRNLETGSSTIMELDHIIYNSSIQEKIFSERYLRRPPRDITR